MFTYIKMKIKEHRIKLALYSSVEKIMSERKDIVVTATNLYLSLKDTPIDELQDKFISALAEVIHNDTHREPIDDAKENDIMYKEIHADGE